MLTLNHAVEALTGESPRFEERIIRDAAIDSRQVTPDSLFIALPGERVDGHDYVLEAFERGASTALVSHELP